MGGLGGRFHGSPASRPLGGEIPHHLYDVKRKYRGNYEQSTMDRSGVQKRKRSTNKIK